MRAEGLRIDAEIIALQHIDGVKIYNLHHLGYQLAEQAGDLTPFQSWFLARLDGFISSIRKKK